MPVRQTIQGKALRRGENLSHDVSRERGARPCEGSVCALLDGAKLRGQAGKAVRRVGIEPTT